MMKSHVLGTPSPLISNSLYVVLMKHDGVSILTDKERRQILELNLNLEHRVKTQEGTV